MFRSKIGMSCDEIDVSRPEIGMSRQEINVSREEIGVSREEIDVSREEIGVSHDEIGMSGDEIGMSGGEIGTSRVGISARSLEIGMRRGVRRVPGVRICSSGLGICNPAGGFGRACVDLGGSLHLPKAGGRFCIKAATPSRKSGE